MPQPGEILCYEDYVFEDSSKGDKLFVVLNSADVDSPCLVLKTTSQSRRYEGARKGCNPQKRVFFVPADWGRCFALDTYIQLPQVLEVSTEELLRGHFNGRIHVISSLADDCFTQLKNCLKQFKQDMSPRHWILIFKS
jgi:hypothetical protein